MFDLLLILFPALVLVGLFNLYYWVEGDEEEREEAVGEMTLYSSLYALFGGLLLCVEFDKSIAGFQNLNTFDVLPGYNFTLTFGVDGFSLTFILLTVLIFPVCFLAADAVTDRQPAFMFLLGVMEVLLILTFSTLDLFWFYVFFESVLIPMFLMIGVWGARARKIKAAYYFFLYTLFGSFFLLFGILYLYFVVGTTNYFVLLNTTLDSDQQLLLWVCFFLAFAVKMPLFPVHIWLPEAHVEAPTVGSMLLASLLLKLGGYGFLRFSLPLLPIGSIYFGPLVSTCALLGIVYASLSTLRQIDLKRIIAYSSVAHMSVVMVGLFSYTQQGIEGAVYLMIGHGFVSAALFFCVGVLYDRTHTRLLQYYGGVATVMPLFATAFFAFTLANMGFPGTSNFVGELLVLLGVFTNNSVVLVFSTAGIVLSAAYSIWLYNRVAFGTLKTRYFLLRNCDLTEREVLVLGTLLLGMLLLGVSADFVLDYLHVPTQALLVTAAANAVAV